MPKNKLSEYSSTASDNTDIGGINIAEGMAPSDVNNAMREQMAQLKEFIDGSSGDTVTTAKIVATTAQILSGASVTGTATFNSAVVIGGVTNLQDNNLQRPKLLDYAVKGVAKGNTGSTITLDLVDGNFFSATVNQATTFTFSNPPASGEFGAFVLELTNGGAFAITWPVTVDWPGGTAPTLTASGKDQLVFTTRDAGTNWYGFVAGLDIKSP
jgi:hypothetical protein